MTEIKFLPLILAILVLSLIPQTTAETIWADQVDESDSITYTIIPGDFESIQDQQSYDMGLGHDGDNGDEYIVNPISGMTSEFDLVNGDRLEIEVTKNGVKVEFNASSDYHLVFLPIEKDGIGFFELLLSNTDLISELTGGTYLNSTIDNIVELYVDYEGEYVVKYEWDRTTGTMIAKMVWDQAGNKLEILPNPNFGLVSVSALPILAGFVILIGIRVVEYRNNKS